MNDIKRNSHDIFDTLLARQCIEASEIFKRVEAKSGHAGFATNRSLAERKAAERGDYGFDDIYEVLAKDFFFDDVISSHFKALELQEEFDNLFPISKNVQLVKPGDLLISDMYLPKSFIQRLVEKKCGLYFNPIILSSSGKASGKAWEKISNRICVDTHRGDNRHSDIAMPLRFGITGDHTIEWTPSKEEKMLSGMGYRRLAELIREARLTSFTGNVERDRLTIAQIEANFPMQFLTALHLLKLARHESINNFLFSSRDCFGLFKVFSALTEIIGAREGLQKS